MTARLLVQIFHSEAGGQFIDDAGGAFISDAGGIFEDSVGILRLSTEDFAGDRYWRGDIISIDPISYRMDQLYGGMVRISGGNMEIALYAFDSADWWLPAISYPCIISVTDGLESEAVIIMEGTIYRKNIDMPLSVSYDLYPKDISVNLLESATDYDGNSVVLPKAFGQVSYVKPIRLADAGGGNRRYSAGGLTGTKHTDWHVYDDGVDVCSNATAISSNVFEYTVTPVGQLTISGHGVSAENWEIFEELCGSSYLNLILMDEGWEYGTISKWQETQIFVTDFLSQVAAVTDAYFYILAGILYLHDMDQYHLYYGTLSYDVETDLLAGTRYERGYPKSIARYKYKTRTAVEETIGKYVKEVEQEKTVLTPWSYGEEITIDAMTATGNQAVGALFNALIYHVGTRLYASIPMSSTAFKPGTKMILTDNRFNNRTVTCTGNIRDIVYDFIGKKINIEGSTTSVV